MKQDTTQATLFELVYDRTATLSVEIEVNTYPNNLTIQAKAIYWLYTGFQDRPEILLNPELDFITVNQMGKITNAQFEKLQNRITQVILEKEVQKILENEELELRDLEDLNGA
ncbi:hypothetical protein G9A89_012824 [Geosiphon pyriformis]|nr:hypothetical protein G9A89_012824 [Geosiphon pyriformis]